MKRKHLWLVTAAVFIILALAACGSQKESADGTTGGGDGLAGESVTEANTDDQVKELKWLSYNLKVEELRDMEESDHFSVQEAPDDSRYVVTKLISANGEIPTDEITEDSTKDIVLKSPDGEEYKSGFLAYWGVEFDAEKGFSTKDRQEGFNLLYQVPKTVKTEDLSIELK